MCTQILLEIQKMCELYTCCVLSIAGLTEPAYIA